MNGPSIKTLRPETLTWDTAQRLFLLRCRAQNVAESTQELYGLRLRGFVGWAAANGAASPADVEAAQLRAFIEARRASGNRPNTIDVYFRILRTFWRFLFRDGLVLRNPMEQLTRPKLERKFIKPITEEQLRALLAAIDTRDPLGLRDHALILFLADTGLRISEALSLQISDIDWGSGSLTVMGKGRKERRVAFGQVAGRMLRLWLQRRGGASESDPLWINRLGGRMDRRNFQQRMKQHTTRAGIAAERLSPHALRHFFALSFLRNGGDVMALQKLLGHSSLAMVRNYVNMTDDDALQAHRRASPLDKLGAVPGEVRRVRLR
ncbi:MAG: tyrosine-type recombinase/integrase [Elusimicrobia bacterium]|nr:tyrosine-type recombinase/integrase [Elusimicrobiota bacterium]